ncbi:MAG: FtsW/RodA/SpoVE family cell cycle protein [Bacilli bacterium]
MHKKVKEPKNKPVNKMNKILLAVTIALVLIGMFSILSASSRETVARYEYSAIYFFKKHVIVLIASLIASLIIFKIPTKYYKILAPVGFCVVGLLIIILFFIGINKRGSQGWFSSGGQPSELMKPMIIMVLAMVFDYYYHLKKRNEPYSLFKFFIIFFIVALIFPCITLIQGDLGTALLTGGIAIIMLLASPLSKSEKFKCLSMVFIIGLVGASTLILTKGRILKDEQIERLTEFTKPCSKYEDSGYQICNGFIAINDGGLFGLGIGDSRQKYSYIPDPHTDSIFSVIIEEMGLFFGMIILFLYGIMIKQILNIASNTKNIRNRYIAFGVASYLFLHIFLNLGGLLAMIPLTGVPLPLISYGGSFTLSFICSIAVIQRINMEIK